MMMHGKMQIIICHGKQTNYHVIPRLSENAKHLSLLSADPSALEAVNPESLRSRDELFSAKLIPNPESLRSRDYSHFVLGTIVTSFSGL